MHSFLQLSPVEIGLTSLFVFLFAFIATFMVILLIYGLGQRKRGASPSLTVNAVVTGKRQESGRRKGGASAAYYVTFEADGGESAELVVDGKTYGLLAEGDAGQLTFQGTRYLGFVRNAGRENL